jgi:predicted nucleic acid-binding protein
MITLADIEAAVEALPTPQQQEFLRRLAERMQRQFPPRLTMASGIETLQHRLDCQVTFSPPDDLPYVELPADLLRGHKQWTDAYLLHLAKRHGLIFATLESRMAGPDDPADRIIQVLT